ncbi:hypothetical protein GPA19_05840 [Azoarcus indigens]|uniref:hypothetical protein n=1 Tax=Azoarcus indigens TaxID=29545 RepID=UPI0013C371AB|nr:hypothetical protein [Azoarcus indigens]NMG64468.1 hypothetical protein [Azoarcus indigens]
MLPAMDTPASFPPPGWACHAQGLVRDSGQVGQTGNSREQTALDGDDCDTHARFTAEWRIFHGVSPTSQKHRTEYVPLQIDVSPDGENDLTPAPA